MIEKLEAVNTFVLIKRDEADTETSGGLILPDQAQVKPAMGKILSVGQMVLDKRIKVGKKALFNKHVGVDIELGDETVTVLMGGPDNSQIIAVL